MGSRWSRERVARILLWAIVAIAALAWVVRRFLDSEGVALLNNLVALLLLVAIPLGFYVVRHPREMPRTGDKLFEEEIDKIMQERSAKKEKR